jgi:serine/threonine-protein kinase RsbW
MNVVVHAYEGRAGPMNVEALPDAEGLTVVVRDSGVGIRPRPDVERASLRIGLSLIAALSASFSFSGGLDRGTEVEMRLPLEGGGAEEGGPGTPVEQPADSTELIVGRTELLAPVLARVVGALAARRDLSVDRVSDAVLLTDAIAASAPGRFADGRVKLALAEDGGALELRLGPMEDGGAEEIREELAVPEVGGSLEALADEFEVQAGPDGDYLAIRFTPASPAL